MHTFGWYIIYIQTSSKYWKMVLEMYSRVCMGKHLSDPFCFENGLSQGDAFLPLAFDLH
jgi:hypothetical protein